MPLPHQYHVQDPATANSPPQHVDATPTTNPPLRCLNTACNTPLTCHVVQDLADSRCPLNDVACKTPPLPTCHAPSMTRTQKPTTANPPLQTRHVTQDPAHPSRPLNNAACKTPLLPTPQRHTRKTPPDLPRPLIDTHARPCYCRPLNNVHTRPHKTHYTPSRPATPPHQHARKTPPPQTRHIAQDHTDLPCSQIDAHARPHHHSHHVAHNSADPARRVDPATTPRQRKPLPSPATAQSPAT
ncbi:hypothetical protein EDB83DRAFT_2527345 [Lactarius deliciosus]|nr:hypothetical protein EDB83DRAFT_2527345 [Lactarius deliciosus]